MQMHVAACRQRSAAEGSERAGPARYCQTLVLLPLACSGRVGQARADEETMASPGQVARGASAAVQLSLCRLLPTTALWSGTA
jgi:hypothetical protein